MNASQVLQVARGEVGTKESGINEVKYNDEYYGRHVSGSDYAWCAVFVWWTFKHANCSSLYYGGEKTAYCPTLIDYYQKNNQFTTNIKDFKPGDIIFFNWDGGTKAQHVGIVVSVNSDGSVNTVEGNTKNGSEGVWEKVRYAKNILGAGRPAYDGALEDFVPDTSNNFLSSGGYSNVSPSYSVVLEDYETISNLASQPFHAFVELWLGNHHVPPVPPQYLLNLEITTLTSNSVSDKESACSGTISLFDKYCDELEYLFITNKDNVKIRFGHVTGRQSVIFNMIATEYSINFTPAGNVLTVKMISKGSSTEGEVITGNVGQTPSDAVRNICSTKGWAVGRIDEAKQLTGQDGELIDFTLINDHAEDYIRNEIAPRSVRTSDGKGGYIFYLDSTTEPPTANFHPIDIDNGTLRTYVYIKGKNSPILDFRLSTTITMSEIAVSEYRSSGINPTTKEEFNIVSSNSEQILDASMDNKTAPRDTDNIEISVTDNVSTDEIPVNTSYRFTNQAANGSAVEGTLTLVGDPTIGIADLLRIIILNEDNSMHSLSGIYFVNGVNHNISSGTLITTVDVFKQSIIDGEVILKSAKVVK